MNKHNYTDFSNQFKDKIINSKSIGICCHVNPDGDALGSMLSLYGALIQLNKNVTCIQSDDIPSYLDFLPGLDRLTPYNEDMEFETLMIVDSSSIDRIGDCISIFTNCKTSISIDHHVTNDNFADLNFVDENASSTSEIVYKIINCMDIAYNADMATNSYVGILTDTNRFLYKNSDSKTLRVAADLIDLEFDKDEIHYELFQKNSMASFCLTGEVIKNTEFYFDNRLALCIVDSSMLDSCNAAIEDTEEKINLLRDIEGVEVACLAKQLAHDEFKISMRSKRYVNVAEICAEFNGGGHIHAGGFSYSGNSETLKRDLMKRFDNIEWNKG